MSRRDVADERMEGVATEWVADCVRAVVSSRSAVPYADSMAVLLPEDGFVPVLPCGEVLDGF